MFSWKKQNPPSQQRQQQQQQNPIGDYSDLIAQGLRLATEDMDETTGGDEYMPDEGDDDLGDIDLDDPDLLAELQGLTGEASVSLPKKPVDQPTVKKQVAPAPAFVPPKPTPTSPQPRDTSSPAPPTTATPPSALAGLGLDLQDVLGNDEDDEEVELTEDDWKDPQFLAQLQSLGGVPGHHEQDTAVTPKKEHEEASKPAPAPAQQPTPPPAQPIRQSLESTPSSEPHQERSSKLASASSSMIAIPPQDNDEEMEDNTSIKDSMDFEPPTPTVPKPLKRLEEIPKTNHKDLLGLLKMRDVQYKKAALDAKKSGDMALAAERVKTFKSIQTWIRLVEAGGFLDLELYPVPDAPPVVKVPESTTIKSVAQESPSISTAVPAVEKRQTSPYLPAIASPAPEPTTQVTNSIAEASAEDMRSGGVVRGAFGGGIEFRPMAADDDFQIVSNSDDDTFDMLQSQLESQIKMCTETCRYYYQSGDKQTALGFNKLNKIFKSDLLSLQSHRNHKMKTPAFHFQDVRFELEVGFYQEIGLNDLSLEIIRAWDLFHKDIQPSDIDAYVTWDLGWPTENMTGAGTGKGTTSTVKRTPRPDFNFTKSLRIERTRAFNKFVERRKATFELWHYRGLLWKDYQLGKAQIPLLPLLHHSEIHEIIPLIDPSTRKATGGKVEVRIRLQRPLLKPEIVIKEEKWLVIDEFNSGGVGFPSPISSTPPSRQAASPALGRSGTPASKIANKAPVAAPRAPVTPKPAASQGAGGPPRATGQNTPSPVQATAPNKPTTSKPTAPTPAPPAPKAQSQTTQPVARPVAPPSAAEPEESESEKALNEVNSVELLVSNNVLENEIQLAQKMVHDARAVGNSELEEEHQDRLTQLEIKMKLLVLQVQTGQLTMEAYCKAVYARIEKDRQLAIACKRLKLLPEAMRALGRSKIMTLEMKEVEEAMAAQGDEDEEE